LILIAFIIIIFFISFLLLFFFIYSPPLLPSIQINNRKLTFDLMDAYGWLSWPLSLNVSPSFRPVPTVSIGLNKYWFKYKIDWL